MTSEPRLALVGAMLLVALTSCGGEAPRFPLREPVLVDNDVQLQTCPTGPASKDSEGPICGPEHYLSPLAWDAVDNSIFIPFSNIWAVDPPGAAVNVNALDEVPDSSWFTNRRDEGADRQQTLLQGACEPSDMLDPDGAAEGSWLVDKGKTDGSTPGFRVRIGERKFMLKTDAQARASGSAVIGAAIYYAVGFNTSCEQIVYVDPKLLKLKPGLTTTDNTGVTKPLDQTMLEKILSGAQKKGPLARMQASAWLPGRLLGPFSYMGTRSDDPNDVIPHEDRRDLRGARVLAAWIDHFDAREQNSMDSWISQDPDDKSKQSGFVRHYYLDFSDTLGSEWVWDDISKRLGHSYLLDWVDIGKDIVTLGIPRRRWDLVQRTPGQEMFGYFHAYDFEPDGWKNEYPNPAFSSADEQDNAWMARILSRFDRPDIDAFVSLGKFEPRNAQYIAGVLEQRLARILQRYLLKVSPLTELTVHDGHRLCAVDLARRRALRAPTAFRYRARLEHAGKHLALEPRTQGSAELCVDLPRVAGDGGAAADDPSRYVIVAIENGAAEFPLLAHLYDLGPRTGYRLVGIERPEQLASD